MNSLKAHGFLFKGGQIEADPRILDAIRKRPGIKVGRAFQDYVVILARREGQHRSEKAFPNHRRCCQFLQRHRSDLTALADPKLMPIGLNDPRSRAKEVHKQSKQRALLQSNQ